MTEQDAKLPAPATSRSSDGLGVREIWIGTYKQCRHYARLEGVENPDVINRAETIMGYAGPLRAHLCGEYYKLDDYGLIMERLKSIQARGEKVEYSSTPNDQSSATAATKRPD